MVGLFHFMFVNQRTFTLINNRLYSVGINFYGLSIRVASLFNEKAKLWVTGRKDFFKQLPSFENKKVYWFHCASLGEFDQALPVINLLKQLDSSLFIVVTFFSPSGYLHYHKRDHKADYVCYLPLDTPTNARKFIKAIQPDKLFFVKYEFWANYIFEAKKTGTKLYSISAIFREEQRFFKKNDSFFKSILQQFDHFFIQNKESETLLESIGIQHHTITGDTRFDRVIENKKNVKENSCIKKFLQNEKAFIIGSSWPVDEQIILPLINNGSIKRKIIIAPHDISKSHIKQITEALTTSYVKYSELEKTTPTNNEQVLILDTIGNLSNAYSYGDIAYVGGGFTGSLHNILEPAVFGLPLLFGPKHKRFPEAQSFINEGIGFEITNSEDFINSFNRIDKDIEQLQKKTVHFVATQTGASQKIIDYFYP